jgi:hypothetical protein
MRRREDNSTAAIVGDGGMRFILGCAMFLGAGRAIAADMPPTLFYYAVGTDLEPQIATLVVGVNENVGQAIVSGDRKYVSLGVDANQLGSGGIHQFKYQHGGLGFVGSAVVQPNVPANNLMPSIAALPSEIAPTISILDKPGMALIAPLER